MSFPALRALLLTVGMVVSLAAFTAVAPRCAAGAEPDPAVFSPDDVAWFETNIRPLLAARCHSCHGPTKHKGGLRLDSRAAALRGGDTGPALTPRMPDKSLLVDAINYGDVYQMPPTSKLPASEIALLTEWVARGAPWPDESKTAGDAQQKFDLAARRASHWCWQPITDPPLPQVRDGAWPRDPLDAFVLTRLEQANLSPAPEPDRRTLIRRLYFDLVGLPPTPAEVEAFLADSTPAALKRAVDGLLASPRFGEHWGRRWLDLVRYADSYGHEFDYPIPSAGEYRNYVIRALNADVPYNQFLVEHLAGDLLAKPRLHPVEGFNESIIGTGFWHVHEAKHAPVDVRAEQAIVIDNQIDVFSKTFLGLTVACARCHDHKFDAIATQDYYALFGVLASSREQLAYLDPGLRVHTAVGKLQTILDRGSQLQRNTLASARSDSPNAVEEYLRAAREVMFGKPTAEDALDVLDAGAPSSTGVKRSVASVAKQFNVDPGQLARWVELLRSPEAAKPQHVLYPWVRLAEVFENVEAFQQRRKELGGAHSATSAAESQSGAGEIVFADFSPGDPNAANHWGTTSDTTSGDTGWVATGEAFGNGPTTSGRWDAATNKVACLQPGLAHSGAISTRLQGALRSPSFTLEKRFINYRLAGKGCRIRLIIDGYRMDVYNGLLFGGTHFDVNTDGNFTWHQQAGDVSRYVGRRAYIEILDDGPGWIAVDEIRFSDQPPRERTSNPFVAEILADKSPAGSADAPADLATRYSSAWLAATQAWSNGSATLEQTEWVAWMLDRRLVDGGDPGLAEQLDAARRELDAVEVPAPMRALASIDGTPIDERVFIRGNHRTLGDVATRRMLSAIGEKPQPIMHGSGRLEIAQELIAPQNPLVARVLVNRVWHHLFGRGIVPTVDDFGVFGAQPTHPELLDHLATRFTREGWSLKRLVREVVLSSTYRMGSAASDAAREVDPQNTLLHSHRLRRLQAEAIRDTILCVSGRLQEGQSNATVPVHLTPFMEGRGKPGGGPLDGDGRRSIYISVQRNFLAPFMLAFDAPIPFTTMGRRNVSNVPAQALILLNDPFVAAEAQRWAERIVSQKELGASERIEKMFVEAFSRLPTASELADAKAFIENQGAAYGTPQDAQAELRLWTDFAHVLFNVKDFVFYQ